MTGSEYQVLAMRTASKLRPTDAFYHGIHMLAAEAGECNGLVQKTFQGHELDDEKMFDELGDVLWAVARICSAMDVTIDDIMQRNIDKLKRRYPDGFEVNRSVNREQ